MGEKREAYIQKLKAKMDEWNAEIDILSAKAEQAKGESTEAGKPAEAKAAEDEKREEGKDEGKAKKSRRRGRRGGKKRSGEQHGPAEKKAAEQMPAAEKPAEKPSEPPLAEFEAVESGAGDAETAEPETGRREAAGPIGGDFDRIESSGFASAAEELDKNWPLAK